MLGQLAWPVTATSGKAGIFAGEKLYSVLGVDMAETARPGVRQHMEHSLLTACERLAKTRQMIKYPVFY